MLFCITTTLYAQEKEQLRWHCRISTNDYFNSIISVNNGEWGVQRKSRIPSYAIDVSKKVYLSSKFDISVGAGIGFLPADIEFIPPKYIADGFAFGEGSMIAPHLYLPISIEYQLFENPKWSIKPSLGGRCFLIMEGIYTSSFSAGADVFKKELVGSYDAKIDKDRKGIFIAAEIGNTFAYKFNAKSAVTLCFQYVYSDNTIYEGDYKIYENQQLVANGTYAKKLNFLAVSVGFQHDFRKIYTKRIDKK